MPSSMTGFGREMIKEDGWNLSWDVKSVNGRFLDIKWRMPLFLRSKESDWEKLVKKFASRGRVDVILNLEIFSPELMGLNFNKPMASSMLEQLKSFSAEADVPFTPDMTRLMSISSLWQDNSAEPNPGLIKSLEQGLEKALESWVRAREEEGEALKKDILTRLETLHALLVKIKDRVPSILDEKKNNLTQRISELVEAAGVQVDEDRMLTEIAVLTDKLDVSEELTRLDAHLIQLAKVMDRKKEVGKRLDFFLQESFREINTCSNKCQDAAISALAVEFKAELEKMREQAQNIE